LSPKESQTQPKRPCHGVKKYFGTGLTSTLLSSQTTTTHRQLPAFSAGRCPGLSRLLYPAWFVVSNSASPSLSRFPGAQNFTGHPMSVCVGFARNVRSGSRQRSTSSYVSLPVIYVTCFPRPSQIDYSAWLGLRNRCPADLPQNRPVKSGALRRAQKLRGATRDRQIAGTRPASHARNLRHSKQSFHETTTGRPRQHVTPRRAGRSPGPPGPGLHQPPGRPTATRKRPPRSSSPAAGPAGTPAAAGPPGSRRRRR